MSDTEFHSSISHIFVDLAYDGTIRRATRPQLVVYRFSLCLQSVRPQHHSVTTNRPLAAPGLALSAFLALLLASAVLGQEAGDVWSSRRHCRW